MNIFIQNTYSSFGGNASYTMAHESFTEEEHSKESQKEHSIFNEEARKEIEKNRKRSEHILNLFKKYNISKTLPNKITPKTVFGALWNSVGTNKQDIENELFDITIDLDNHNIFAA